MKDDGTFKITDEDFSELCQVYDRIREGKPCGLIDNKYPVEIFTIGRNGMPEKKFLPNPLHEEGLYIKLAQIMGLDYFEDKYALNKESRVLLGSTGNHEEAYGKLEAIHSGLVLFKETCHPFGIYNTAMDLANKIPEALIATLTKKMKRWNFDGLFERAQAENEHVLYCLRPFDTTSDASLRLIKRPYLPDYSNDQRNQLIFKYNGSDDAEGLKSRPVYIKLKSENTTWYSYIDGWRWNSLGPWLNEWL